MRLLNAETLRLVDFQPNKIPPYAILSHTWGDDEVVFSDLRLSDLPGLSVSSAYLESYMKIRYSADQALADGLRYIWIDTICIDKSSSAELSEAINSMYEWYRRAVVCYAYLADVLENDPHDCSEGGEFQSKIVGHRDSDFTRSRWFTRGWTLQELIAPRTVTFFDKTWNLLGDKSNLTQEVARATGIDRSVIAGVKELQCVSVAQRMSWAARRETTRVEDLAYCLLGVFSVNMPLLYGEGMKVFLRLQQHILQETEDQSIFAWTDATAESSSWHGLLAKDPSLFTNCTQVASYRDWRYAAPAAMTSSGLAIDLPLRRDAHDMFEAKLNCTWTPRGVPVSLNLERIPGQENHFARINVCQCRSEAIAATDLKRIYVRQNPVAPQDVDILMAESFSISSVRVDSPWLRFMCALTADSQQVKHDRPPINERQTIPDVKGLGCALLFQAVNTMAIFILLLGRGPQLGTLSFSLARDDRIHAILASSSIKERAGQNGNLFFMLELMFKPKHDTSMGFEATSLENRTVHRFCVKSLFEPGKKVLLVDIVVRSQPLNEKEIKLLRGGRRGAWRRLGRRILAPFRSTNTLGSNIGSL